MQRRQFFSLAGSLVGLFAIPMHLFAANRRVTPADTEGPFYPVKPIPIRSNLIQGTQLNNQAMALDGQVLDKNGKPLVGARVEIWQCDNKGVYDHPNQYNSDTFDPNFNGFGAQITNDQGYYKFKTIYPVPYTGRPPHIHVKVWNKKQELLTTQLYLQGNTGSNWYKALREPLQINPKKAADGQLKANFTFIV